MAAVALGNSTYKEHQGVDFLSRTIQSNLAFSPGDTARRTASEENFRRKRAQEEKILKTPWGRKCSYGGYGPVCLPEDHRPKTEPPLLHQKGHRHFSSGVCIHPRYVTTSSYYDLTSLKRSNVRANDELIAPPQKEDVTKHVVKLPFPAEHPFATHIPRTGTFPPYERVEHPSRYVDMQDNPPDVTLMSKARGAAYRYEKLDIPNDDQQKPLQWLEGPNFFQIVKGKVDAPIYYPTPIKSLKPNMIPSMNVCSDTKKELKNMRTSQMISTNEKSLRSAVSSESKKVEFEIPLAKEDEQTNLKDDIKEEDSKNEIDSVERPRISTSPQWTKSSSSKSFISASYPPLKSAIARDDYADLVRGWSRSNMHRSFNSKYNDQLADLRRKPDLRITTNERRHRFPEYGNMGSYVCNGLSIPYLKGHIIEQ